MGLWHNRVINTKNPSIAKEYSFFSSLLSKKILLYPYGDLALTSSPYISQDQFFQNLYTKGHIKLAVDGQISNFKNNANPVDDIVNLYQTYGNEGLYRLKGAFSLILYDESKQLTLLYRSFLTGNPLYFVSKNNLLSVSTNPVYLLHRSDISDTLDSEEMSAIFSFDFSSLTGNVFSELTVVENGEIVIITPEKTQHIKRPLSEVFMPQHYGSESNVIEKYRFMIEEKVAQNLLPDIDHGIMLSSGMDSSTIAVFAKQALEREKRKLTAYSWTLPNDPSGDESVKIKELCKALDIPLKLFNGEGFAPFESLDNTLLLPDTPYTNPYWLINSETYRNASADGIGALLGGGYGDMLYRRNGDILIDIVRDKRFELFFPEVNTIIHKMGYYKALKHSSLVRAFIRNFIPDRLLNLIKKEAPLRLSEWLSRDARNTRSMMIQKKMQMISGNKFGDLSLALSPYQAGYLGVERYLSGEYGIKRIDPYIDTELLNYTRGIPSYMTYRKGQTKYFAREAMRGLLPESIRVQPRVGTLTQLFHDGYNRNKKVIRERLLDDHTVWKQYVDESWMERKLNSADSLDAFELLVFWLSLNIQQWQKAIKPGGSLYEGTFMKNTSHRLK